MAKAVKSRTCDECGKTFTSGGHWARRIDEGMRHYQWCSTGCFKAAQKWRTPCDNCWGPHGRRRDFSRPDSPALCDTCA